jgi:hypothetical protein
VFIATFISGRGDEFASLWARNLAVQVIILTVGFSVISSQAEAAPFAYVNPDAVIDTATNKVVGTLDRRRHYAG